MPVFASEVENIVIFMFSDLQNQRKVPERVKKPQLRTYGDTLKYVLIFPTIWKVSIFLPPMLNIPTIFDFGLNIQKFFDNFVELRSIIT